MPNLNDILALLEQRGIGSAPTRGIVQTGPGSYERRDSEGRLEFSSYDPSEARPSIPLTAPNPSNTNSSLASVLDADKAAALNRNTQYNDHLTEAYGAPYQQGPLPSLDKLSADPKWWQFYQQAPDKANALHTKLTGEPFDIAYKRDKEQKNFFLKTLQEKFQSGKVRQNDFGDWEEQETIDDPIKGKSSVWVKANPMLAEAIGKIGGAKALGLTDRKDSFNALPPSQQALRIFMSQGMNEEDAKKKVAGVLAASGARPRGEIPAPVSDPTSDIRNIRYNLGEEPPTYHSSGLAGLFHGPGNPDADPELNRRRGELMSRDVREEILGQTDDKAIGNHLFNLLNHLRGGEIKKDIRADSIVSPGSDLRRQIDIARGRKGLPALTEQQWSTLHGRALLQ